MVIPTTYVPYHMHTMLSNGVTNIDSITDFHKYVDLAKENGMKAFGFSEHGCMFAWLKKKEYIESCGMKYIHAIEAYITEDDASTINKRRDNYHIVLIAKNESGEKELNKLISNSFHKDDFHFYYVPRISFDELYETSDNILITTACLGGVLNKGTPSAKERYLNFLIKNKHRCFLEIQHHNTDEQKDYNVLLYNLHNDYDIPLIAGTDTHALDDVEMEGRSVLQKAKNVFFENEDKWDLTFKTIDELIEAYKQQDSLPMEVVYEAIEETNRMADMIEEFTVDYSPKYPKLYEDSEEVFKKKINEGYISRGINKYPNRQEYIDRIHYEYEVYKHNGAIDFMLLEENYKTEMRKRGIKYGYSRGSVSGSIIAYLLYITEIDSVKFNLNFERFMNSERVSLADIDTDWLADDRKVVKEYLFNKKGLYCCDIVTFNTIALKGAIKDVCRGLYKKSDKEIYSALSAKWRDAYDDYNEKAKCDSNYEMPKDLADAIDKVGGNYLAKSEQIIKEAEKDIDAARKKYPEVFKYVDLVNGVVVSVGNHPAGCVVSPFPVDEWFGTFYTSTDEYPVSELNMKEIDSLNFVKLDILGLDNIGLIYKTCEEAGIPFATPDNIPADDIDVWNSIREDTTMIFQWESQSATAYLRQLLSDNTIEKIRERNKDVSYIDLLSLGNGAIRPAGESYRDKLAQGIYQDNGHEALNEFLKPTLGYVVYQEQVIEFLHSFCGYTMGEADIVRRGFAKKTGTEQFIPKIKEGFRKTMLEKYGVSEEESEKLIVNFIRVIEDASSYLFSKNHSDPYSWIGYICGYLRYHYPLEFITTALNIFYDKEDKTLAIIDYAKSHGIRISPIKFRHSVSQYSYNKETGEIYKGIESIKYMNSTVASEMYALKDNKYDTFIDLLNDLSEKTTLNSRQLNILVELDFFSEFGDAIYLQELIRLYGAFNGKKNIKKDTLAKYNISEDLVRACGGNETEKMFKGADTNKMLVMLAKELTKHKYRRSLKNVIAAQVEHLGYIDIADKRYNKMLAILDVNTKYAPRIKAHSLSTGKKIEFKVDKRTFNTNKLEKGDIIKVVSRKEKPKMRMNEFGQFEAIPDTQELWLTKYEKVSNL